MPEFAWDGVISRDRTLVGGRPRTAGLNMILDKGLAPSPQDVLEVAADHRIKPSFGRRCSGRTCSGASSSAGAPRI
jgi:hypothetical protein